MTSRTVEAVAACARTLAGAADIDTALAAAGAVTLGPLRALSDRVALRRRFHDESAHADWRPVGHAAGLYESLSQARLDALGARWLAGIAHNLLAYPGTDEDGLRWLAFECLSGVAAPPEKRTLVEAARAALSASLFDELARLAGVIDQPTTFAEHAAAWCVRAAGSAPVPRAAEPASRLQTAAASGDDPRRGRYALPGRTAPEGGAHAGTADHDATSSPAAHDAVVALAGYRPYSTSYDRVVQASALASRDELARLRLVLDADFSQLRTLVARVAKRLMRAIMARQTREWRFDLEEGLIDPGRLPAFVASGGATRPFKQEFEAPFPSTAVTLLIDHSGSMKGRPMRIAALTVEILARVLERCGVVCEILGFTTRDWDGGEPARHWAEAGYPPHPGRLNALEHIVIKAADVPWRRARPALGLFLRDDMLKENIDGEAVAWAHRRLLARAERRRILLVVSDGTPMDEATFAANGFDYLDGHLAAVVEHIETRSPVKLAAIGIGHDVSQFYRNASRISRADDLGSALAERLISLLGDERA